MVEVEVFLEATLRLRFALVVIFTFTFIMLYLSGVLCFNLHIQFFNVYASTCRPLEPFNDDVAQKVQP